MSEILSLIFGLIGVIGVILTVHYERKSRKLERLSKSLSWAELQAGTNDLVKKFRGDFKPEIILTPNLRGGILSYLIVDNYDHHIPVFVGQIFWRKQGGEIPTIPDHIEIKTGKWMLYIPKSILEFNTKRLLIVDDFAMSGDTIEKVKQQLISNGYPADLIKTVSLVTTTVAVNADKTTDYYWKISEDDSFYFPWGKAR